MTPHELFNAVVKSTGDRVVAIRTIRERFGLDLRQAKEVMLQAEGAAASLDEHEERIAADLEEDFEEPALVGDTRVRRAWAKAAGWEYDLLRLLPAEQAENSNSR